MSDRRCAHCGHLEDSHDANGKVCYATCDCRTFVETPVAKRCAGCRHWSHSHDGKGCHVISCSCKAFVESKQIDLGKLGKDFGQARWLGPEEKFVSALKELVTCCNDLAYNDIDKGASVDERTLRLRSITAAIELLSRLQMSTVAGLVQELGPKPTNCLRDLEAHLGHELSAARLQPDGVVTIHCLDCPVDELEVSHDE